MPESIYRNASKAARYRLPVALVLVVLAIGSLAAFSIPHHSTITSWMVARADEPTPGTIKRTARYEAIAANWRLYRLTH